MIYSDSAEGYKVRNVGRVDLAPEVVVLCTEVHLLFFFCLVCSTLSTFSATGGSIGAIPCVSAA